MKDFLLGFNAMFTTVKELDEEKDLLEFVVSKIPENLNFPKLPKFEPYTEEDEFVQYNDFKDYDEMCKMIYNQEIGKKFDVEHSRVTLVPEKRIGYIEEEKKSDISPIEHDFSSKEHQNETFFDEQEKNENIDDQFDDDYNDNQKHLSMREKLKLQKQMEEEEEKNKKRKVMEERKQRELEEQKRKQREVEEQKRKQREIEEKKKIELEEQKKRQKEFEEQRKQREVEEQRKQRDLEEKKQRDLELQRRKQRELEEQRKQREMEEREREFNEKHQREIEEQKMKIKNEPKIATNTTEKPKLSMREKMMLEKQEEQQEKSSDKEIAPKRVEKPINNNTGTIPPYMRRNFDPQKSPSTKNPPKNGSKEFRKIPPLKSKDNQVRVRPVSLPPQTESPLKNFSAPPKKFFAQKKNALPPRKNLPPKKSLPPIKSQPFLEIERPKEKNEQDYFEEIDVFLEENDYYLLFGVTKESSFSEISKRRREITREQHPDNFSK